MLILAIRAAIVVIVGITHIALRIGVDIELICVGDRRAVVASIA